MRHHTFIALLAGTQLFATAPLFAGNQLIVASERVAVAKSALSVVPDHEWNKLADRPGRNCEEWTLDGDALNDLTFYSGIEDNKPLFREVDKKSRPLPRFSSTMLLTDVPALLEQSYRIALDTPLITIETVEPGSFAGNKAVRFRYSFVRQNEEVRRSGEGLATITGGKLYLVTFEAPVVFYFDRDIAKARAIFESARLN